MQYVVCITSNPCCRPIINTGNVHEFPKLVEFRNHLRRLRSRQPRQFFYGWLKISELALGIFRRPQHQCLTRDILHQAQGGFYVFVFSAVPIPCERFMDKYKNHKNPLNRMGAKPLVPAFRFGLIIAKLHDAACNHNHSERKEAEIREG